MQKYAVFWKDTQIGEVFLDENSQRYVANLRAIKELKEKGIEIIKPLQTDTEGDIPFLYSVLRNCERFDGNGNEMGYHNNYYSLKK